MARQKQDRPQQTAHRTTSFKEPLGSAVEAAYRELRQLQAVTDIALSYLTLEHLLDELLVRVVDIMDVDEAAILFVEEPMGSPMLVLRAAEGFRQSTDNVRIPVGEGFVGQSPKTAPHLRWMILPISPCTIPTCASA